MTINWNMSSKWHQRVEIELSESDLTCFIPSPAPASSTARGGASNQPQSASGVASKGPKSAVANGLVLNLVLSDSLFNVFRDHNFDSCTMCVCSNAGNTRGRDAAKYLPKYSGEAHTISPP